MAPHGDAMVRTSTEQLVPQQNPNLLPGVSQHWRRALAHWVVSTLVAGNATGSALVHVLATAGIARVPWRMPGIPGLLPLFSTPPLHPSRCSHW